MVKRVAFHNLGCKVNSYETEYMQQEFEKKGYEIVHFEQKADVYIINTCSVTNIADRKSRQMLHRAKKENPEAIVVACGCYVQTRGAEEVLADGVDIVIGNNSKSKVVDLIENYLSECIDINATKEYEEMQLLTTAEHTRAYIKVQDGCNQFCSYCIIPFSRGRVRSREKNSVLEEIRKLAKRGYSEFVLTGIHLSSYGVDLNENPEGSKNDWIKNNMLLDLIKAVCELEGVKRLRLGSLEPRIVTREFAKEIAGIEKICPHFHLSLQSGCEETLKRMNRHYSPLEYKQGVEYLREAFFSVNGILPAITTDVIVGFPGETEEEFEASRKFVEEIEFFETHIFKYSRRKGTRAAVMDNQLTDATKSERSDILQKLHNKNRAAYISAACKNDQEFEMLVEEGVSLEGVRYQVGYTKEYIRAALICDDDLTGKIVSGTISMDGPYEDGRQICIMSNIRVKLKE